VESIYGNGKLYNYETRKLSDFKGFIEKDKIDSSKVIENNSILYHQFWLKDNRSLSFEEDKIIRVAPDPGKNIWLVLDENEMKLIKISDSEISEVQVPKINWITTSIVSVLGIGLLILLIGALSVMNGISIHHL
ncbi:MAG: hypothetical protein ACM34M_14305, partial [Ignavibacteria bacterium]